MGGLDLDGLGRREVGTHVKKPAESPTPQRWALGEEPRPSRRPAASPARRGLQGETGAPLGVQATDRPF